MPGPGCSFALESTVGAARADATCTAATSAALQSGHVSRCGWASRKAWLPWPLPASAASALSSRQAKRGVYTAAVGLRAAQPRHALRSRHDLETTGLQVVEHRAEVRDAVVVRIGRRAGG